MARKYIVIPEEMYKNLLQSQNSEIIGTDSSKINLDKIKKSRTKNSSAKNVLYNQELRRYLKIKKEEDEKPVKVELSNGLKGLSKKNSTTINNSPISTTIKNSPISTTETPISATETPNRSRIFNSLQIINEDDNESETFEDIEEPQASTSRKLNKSFQETPKSTNLVSRFEKIIQIINQNPDEFNVRNNRVLNIFGNPIVKSNALDSLRHILNVSSVHTWGSPPGTSNLLLKLREHDEPKEILSQKSTRPPTARIYRRWQANQKGEGVIKRVGNPLKIIAKFKPQVWMKK